MCRGGAAIFRAMFVPLRGTTTTLLCAISELFGAFMIGYFRAR